MPLAPQGSDHFNRSMRHYAKARGYSLSDHGIVSATKLGSNNIVRGTINLFPAESEEDIFHALGLEYVGPTERNTDVKEVARPMLDVRDREGAPRLAADGAAVADVDGLLE